MANVTNSEIKNAADGLCEALVQFSCLLNEKCSGINVAERYLDVHVCRKGLGICVSNYWNCCESNYKNMISRVSALSIMNVEAKVLNMIKFNDIINIFVDKKTEKAMLSYKPSWWYHGNFV